MKVSVRFGIKGAIWFFPNAAVFVVKINDTDYQRFEDAINTVRGILMASGNNDLAQKIVFEKR